jgi:uncharacterized membrane protein
MVQNSFFHNAWRLTLLIYVAVLLPTPLLAQELHQDFEERVSATVLSVEDTYERDITGTDATATVQELRIELESGEREGEIVDLRAEQVELAVGDKIYVSRVVDIAGNEYVEFADFERRPVLLFVALLFMVMLVLFAGWQGIRALVSLFGSIAAIFFVLVPALLAGYNPALMTVGIAAIVLAFVLFGTHGFNPRTIIAFFGTYSAVAVTGLIAYFSVDLMRFTGFSSDASVYLNFATNGGLDLAGLLLGGIIIGILGVLDDVSITQASVVQELKRANPKLHFAELYAGAIRVGKDHIGSLVNTLALAYVGVSLPLILLFSKTESSWLVSLNQEVVAAELVRIIIGSIGLILAVPFTTLAAAWWYHHHEVDCSLAPHDHHHHHHH